MASVRFSNLLALSLVLGSPALAAPETDVALTSREFLDALATNPAAAKSFVTGDAVAVVGDIGGPFADFLRDVRPKIKWLASCRVTSLIARPLPEAHTLTDDEVPPRLQGGRLSVVEGSYSCISPSGRKVDVSVSVMLKNGRIVQFTMQP